MKGNNSMSRLSTITSALFLFIFIFQGYGESLSEIKIRKGQGITISEFVTGSGKKLTSRTVLPLFSVDLNGVTEWASKAKKLDEEKSISFKLAGMLEGQIQTDINFKPGWKAVVLFRNISSDTVKLENFVPFGQSKDRIYLTASGPWSLARTKLFRPELGPVGVVLPDNAWDLGYGDIPLDENYSVCSISRRTKVEGGERRRWWTLLPPRASVEFTIYADLYQGEWQNGLRLMFQDRYLYDLEKFDDTLYQRKDLAWVRNCYVITTQMAWDHEFYDAARGGYQYNNYLEMGNKLFGGWDIYILWPTWPTLGLDQRNQWDLYDDLPGGLQKIRQLSNYSRRQGTKFFISYNPWDQSTRKIDPYRGMADLIRATNADGIILDTYGWSTAELQATVDSIKPGVVMYSEGMAVPKDLPGIITGRVHDAIYMPPPLNLNKFIKPENTIFRVCQLHNGEMHRETSVSFFNGYGVEINVYRPGRPAWMKEEYLYLGKLARILKENSVTFYSHNWTPLIPTTKDSIWVNKWPGSDKTLYTVLSLIPEGFNDPLFREEFSPDIHFVSLIHHEEIQPDTISGKTYVKVKTEAFNQSWLNTRREGNVDCVAKFPELLKVDLKMDSLTIEAGVGDNILVWAGNPSYKSQPKSYSINRQTLKLTREFGRYEGKYVVQLFGNDELKDEVVVYLKMQTPRIISEFRRTSPSSTTPEGMVQIPAVKDFLFKNQGADGIIPYPDFPDGKMIDIRSFYMDKYPVTNLQFKKFLDATNYQPQDTLNFLKHWINGTYPKGEGNFPVVHVSYEDARAYAAWAGKRLPTESEWQYAAQAGNQWSWPWRNEFDSTRCNYNLDRLTPVDMFPNGENPFGLLDLVGNVWQLTNDLYDNGSYYFIIIRGGSYYHPTSSWWYVKGGPQPLNRNQMLLRVSPGFERNATVGFRCVKDSE